MEDRQIIELYWERAEEAIRETDVKYGRLCRYIAQNILASPEDSAFYVTSRTARSASTTPGWGCGTPSRPSGPAGFPPLWGASPATWH